MGSIAPLDFSLSSKGLAVTGSTNSAQELREFIKKLDAILALLPECWANHIEAKFGGKSDA